MSTENISGRATTKSANCADCGHPAVAYDDLGCATPIAFAGWRVIYCG